MILYIFAIWLVSCYSSSGAPASLASSGAPITNANNASDYSVALGNLAISCENPFLSAQIKNKLKDCPSLVPPYSESQFQCMLFYDINKQLCSAVASNKLALTGDYTASINAPQDIVQLCNAAKGWTFTNLGEEYKKSVNLVFEDVLKCATICSDDNAGVTDIKSNYYCNYFKWGSDLLHAQKIPQTGVATGVGAPSGVAYPDSKSVVKQERPTSVVLPNPKVNLTSILSNVQGSIDSHNDKVKPEFEPKNDLKSTSEKANSVKVDSTESHVQTPIEKSPSAQLTAIDEPKEKPAEDIAVKDNDDVSGQEQANIPPPPEGHVDEHIVNNSGKPTKNDEIKLKTAGDAKIKNSANDAINSQLQVPKNDVGDGDDYQNDIDSDEARGLSDTQGIDDGDDPAVGDSELVKDLDQHKKKVELQFTDVSQKEYYPNAITDGFPEEDDHFFPFFLTAIIMVVLLYVLYHNKSKIMGLIVEGRQPGRRRNSRGHAYKRLDTLEQAMSTNSSAPPSKIIY